MLQGAHLIVPWKQKSARQSKRTDFCVVVPLEKRYDGFFIHLLYIIAKIIHMKNNSAKEKILSCSEDESKVSHHTKCICYNYSLRIDELHALFSKRKQHEQNGESVVRLVRTVI